MSSMPDDFLAKRKEETNRVIATILGELEKELPEETELLWAFAGGLLGAGAALAMLFFFGKVTGLSAPGITSGLAALGSFLGGGMFTGLCLLLLPAPLFAIAGYTLARARNRMQILRATRDAAENLDALRKELARETHLFTEELRALDWLIVSMRQSPIP